MERGDISQPVTKRFVVTLVPTIVLNGYERRRAKLLPLSKRAPARVAAATINVPMMQWIEHTSYTHLIAFEVWHVAADTEFERRIFTGLVERIEPYIERGVSSWEHYDEHTAASVLLASPHIATVYDADHDRLERCWGMRGYRVPMRGTP